MNVAHHGVYPLWMETARTEILRRRGCAYRELEAQGIYFVVAHLNLRYHRPAYYDDLIRVHVRVMPARGIKVEHHYEIYRNDQLLAQGQTTLVCVDREGQPRKIPAGII